MLFLRYWLLIFFLAFCCHGDCLAIGEPLSGPDLRELVEVRALYRGKQYRTALKRSFPMYDRSVDRDDFCGQLRNAYRIGRCYQKLYRQDSAMIWFRRVVATDWQDRSPEFIVASALSWIGYGLMKESQYDSAVCYLQQCLDLSENIGGRGAVRLSSRAHTYLMGVYSALDEPDQIEFHSQKSLAFAQKGYSGWEPRVGDAHGNVANMYLKQEDEEKAREHLLLALECYRGQPESRHTGHAGVYEKLSSLAIRAGQYPLALQYLAHAEPIFLRAFPKDHPRLAYLYNQFCYVLLVQGLWERALFFAEKAGSVLEKHPHLIQYGRNLAYRGLIARVTGREVEAQNFFSQAREVFWKTPVAAEQAHFFQLQGWAHEIRGQGDAALICYHRGLQVLYPDLGSDPLILPDSLSPRDAFLKIELCRAKGRVLALKGNKKALLQALKTFDRAIQLLNHSQKRLYSDQNQLGLREALRSLFIDGVNTAVQLHEETGDSVYLWKALNYAEQGRAAVLLRATQSSQARSFARVPDNLLQRERKLRFQIAKKRSRVGLEESLDPPDRDRLARMKRELAGLWTEMDSLRERFRKLYPRYHAIRYQSHFLTADQIASDLRDWDIPVVEFFDADSLFYAFLIQNGNIRLHRFRRDSLLLRRVQIVRNPHSRIDSVVKAAHELYQGLLEPLFPEGKLPERLCLIPADLIHYVPFDLLVCDRENGKPSWLLQKSAIHYQFSLNLALKAQNAERKAGVKYLGVAPGYERSEHYPYLKHSEAEVLAAQKIWGGVTLRGEEACKERFIELSGDYSLLHISSHAESVDSLPSLSYLSFAEDCPDGSVERLSLAELYALDLRADLCVLSACETGIGEIKKGEGVMSLARGFFYAGSASVVTTLWKVNHNSTRQLLTRFFDYLDQGFSKDLALRKAKLDFLSDDNLSSEDLHPYFWAGIVAIGDMAPLRVRSTSLFWLLIPGLLTAVAIYWWRRRRVKSLILRR